MQRSLACDVAYKVVDFVNGVTTRIHIDLIDLHCQLKAIVTYESVLSQRVMSARSVLMSMAVQPLSAKWISIFTGHTITRRHIDVGGLQLPPGAMMMTRPVILPQGHVWVHGPTVLGSTFMSIVSAATSSHVDVCGLYCCWGHIGVSGLCCHLRLRP